jgi:tetratricopeptide (TPR) repeat protein
MLRNADSRSRKGSGHGIARATHVVALLLGLVASMAAPLWSQTPPKPTFSEIEKRATEARDAKRLEDAVTLYREALKLKPSWDEGTWYLGTSLYGLKRYAEARDSFRHLAISQPDNGQAWALAGMCEFELKNYPRALEYLLRSESTGFGENSEANSGETRQLAYLVRFRIALLLNRAGEPRQALDRLIVIATEGTYPEVIEAMGLSLLRAPLLPSEVPDQDRDLYVRAGEAMSAYVAHDTETATRLFDELVAAYPERPNVHFARGAFLMEIAPDRALQEFLREIELNPSNANALLQIAKLYTKQGAPEKALPYARRTVKADPNAPEAHRVLGESLLESGDAAAAIQELETAVRLGPEFPQPHFLLAQAYRRAGKKALADKEMAEFQRLDKKQKSEFSKGGGTQK